jgi:hypothetical protein
VIKFVSDLQQVGGFSLDIPVSSINILHDHTQTVTDLNKELQEKDEAFEKLQTEYEGQLMVSTSL